MNDAVAPAPRTVRAPIALLSRVHARLAGSRGGRRVLDTLHSRRLMRAWLRQTVLRGADAEPDDLTVVIGVRNRSDHRLANALRSLRAQTGLAGPLHLVVVDWGSDPCHARRTESHCRRFDAAYVRIDGPSVWSRSRCLNVAIRRVRTKLLMVTDVDVVLSPGYLSDAVQVLREKPFSVVCAPFLELPPESVEQTARAAESDAPLDLDAWKASSTPLFGTYLHPSMAVSFTAFFQLIRGYDEYYELWGREDEDLIRRLRGLGLHQRAVGPRSFYLHQWHPRLEGVRGADTARRIRANREYFARTHAILRNDLSWGTPPMSDAPGASRSGFWGARQRR